MRFKLFIPVIVIYYIYSCSNEHHTPGYSPFIYTQDTISQQIKFAETVFTIPSPVQYEILLKGCNVGFTDNWLNVESRFDKISHNPVKTSLIIGMLGSELSNLNLNDLHAQTLKNLNALTNLLREAGFEETQFNVNMDKMQHNLRNHEVFINALSQLYRINNQTLNNSDHYELSVLITTGGWIESFYDITQAYAKTKRSEIYEIIITQGQVIDNLIKMLAPYYEKSLEYADLIDDLVNLAYEFDGLDMLESISTINTDSVNCLTKVHNHLVIGSFGSKLDRVIQSTDKIHMKLLTL